MTVKYNFIRTAKQQLKLEQELDEMHRGMVLYNVSLFKSGVITHEVLMERVKNSWPS